MVRNERAASDELVAIIGMACRLPGGSASPEEFWKFLLQKKCGISEVPADRWGVDVFYDKDPDAISKSVSKWAGFINDVRKFDPKVFGISPREAASMDPQQRLLLLATYEAMQDSGIQLERYSEEKTGVFVGISQSDYRTIQELRLTNTESFAGTGYALCINANRISHRLNLSGPSIAVDTACSSSMVALDQGVSSLRSGDCDTAVIAGVNILAHPSSFVAFSKAGMLSKTGKISTFDKDANGFVRGEGVGVVIIKPYKKAVADGDRIHAVIHATSVNQDGHTSTMTAPSQDAQIDMLQRLCKKSKVPRDHIGFVEAHGTGTPIGDPIEAGAIGRVIGQHSPDRPVYVGSGKANVGHLESAAGITGLIKATLAVKHGVVPPNIHFKSANPNIPFDALNLKVPTKPEPFPEVHGRRFAVVNSFGFGGTNASTLISSPPKTHKPVDLIETVESQSKFPLFFPLSGVTREALSANAQALLFELSPKGRLADVALQSLSVKLAKGRSHLSHRAIVLANSLKELKSALRLLAKGDDVSITAEKKIIIGQAQTETKLCFMFSGQGSQWWAMARDLLENNTVFARAVEDFDTNFITASGWSIKKELLRDECETRIDDTTVTQPALFAIQTGLAALWAHFGIKPNLVLGHSIGEAAASYVAGGLSLAGAARFLNKRGAIRDQLDAKGAMAAVGMQHEDVEALLPDHGKIGIAAINGPGSTTISGDYDAIHEFVDEFSIAHPNTFIRILTVDTAWHSYQLEAGEAWFRNEMAHIDWMGPHTPFISTVTGKLESRFDTDYGWLNLRRPVKFQRGIETALSMGATTFLELGPDSTLAGPTTSTALEAGARAEVLNSISRRELDTEVFARTAAQLFVSGYDLNWDNICGAAEDAVELPTNAWSNEDYWKDSEESRALLLEPVKHPFLGIRSKQSSISWHSEINLSAYSYLKDHRLQSDTIFPAAGYIDMIIAAGHEMFGDKPFEIEEALIHDAMFIGEDQDIILSSDFSEDRGKLKLSSRVRDSREEWVLRSEAFLRVTDVPAPKDIKFDMKSKSLQKIDLKLAYDVDQKNSFINYGDAFQVIQDLWMTKTRTIAHMKLKDGGESTFARHFAHPTILDGCLQITDPRMTLRKINIGREPGDPTYLPVGARRIRCYDRLPKEILVHAKQVHNPNSPDAEGGFVVTNLEGKVLMTVDGLMMKSLPTNDTGMEEEGAKAHFARQSISEIRNEQDLTEAIGTPGEWLVLANHKKSVVPLLTELEAQGATASALLRREWKDDLVGSVSDRFGPAIEEGRLKGIIFACALNAARFTSEDTSADILTPIEQDVKDLISLGDLMDFHRTNEHGLPKIVVLTHGAYPDIECDFAGVEILRQAPVMAVFRALATETPEYTVRLFDVDEMSSNSAGILAKRILGTSAETEVILRGERAYGTRLKPVELEDFEPETFTVSDVDRLTNFHATMKTPGVIDDLSICEIPLESLGEGEVRVRISAVGLNFRDVMAVTGLLPTDAEPDPAWQHLGLEFGAVVEAVGKKVKKFKAGDRVMGLGRRCLQRFMTVNPETLTLLPEHISLEEAATIPSAFATAHYALNRVGRIASGEKVLIHVATGGVGTAAVQLAQAAGAEIFATAGNPSKRRILKDLGVQHVMDSRSLKFADDVERITKGQGVDLLLNSLPGDYITKGLDIIAPYGRFVEIGKRDVYADSSIGMKALRKNISLSVLDLAAMGGERPDLLAEMFTELVAKFESRELTPLPITTFPISKLADAFRYMSQARHVGKVVVTLQEPEIKVLRNPNRPVSLDKLESYLITGGTKGFGLTIADWMSRAGAGQLYLGSRSGTIEEADADKIASIEARGTSVKPVKLDVNDSKVVEKFVIKATKTKKYPLRGVVHGAALIKDGFANQLTPDMISDVLKPKILGGWNLHRAFEKAGIPPSFFISFSSIAQVIGSGGQSNYVAANAFLEALAVYRKSLGLRATTINWGAIAESGFISRNDGLGSYLESIGLLGLSDAETDVAMEVALSRSATSFTYSKADWPQIARANTNLGADPRFAAMLQTEKGGNHEIRARLMSLTGEALLNEISDFVQDEICNVLKIEKSTIQTDRPMSELGLDSLSSFELKMRIETALDFTLPVSKFLQAPSVDELTEILSGEVADMLAAEEANLLSSSDEPTDAGLALNRNGPVASNRQVSLIFDTLAPMTSRSAKLAMQHQVTTILTDMPEAKQIEIAIKKLCRRHLMLRLKIENGFTDKLVQFDGKPTLNWSETADPVLALGKDEFVRISITPTKAGARLEVLMHMAVGDKTSASIVLAELCTLLKGEALTKTVSASKIAKAMEQLHYDPEDSISQNDKAFWWYNLVGTAEAVPFGNRGRPIVPTGFGRDHGPAKVLEGFLSGQHDEHTILRAFTSGLRKATRSSGPVLVNRYSNLRNGPLKRAGVGPFEIAHPVVVDPSAADLVTQGRLHRAIAGTAHHLKFDMSKATTEFVDLFNAWDLSPLQIGFADCTTESAPFSRYEHALYDVFLEVKRAHKGIEYRLVYDTDVLADKTAKIIEKTFKKILVPAKKSKPKKRTTTASSAL